MSRKTSTSPTLTSRLGHEEAKGPAITRRPPVNAQQGSAEGKNLGLSKRRLQTMEQIADKTFEHLPLTSSPANITNARSVTLAIPLKRSPVRLEDFLYISAVARLPQKPSEPDQGYTEEDLMWTTEVYLFKRDGGRLCGQGFPLEALLHELTKLSLRDRVIARTAEMTETLSMDDDFFDEANRRLVASGCGVLYWPH